MKQMIVKTLVVVTLSLFAVGCSTKDNPSHLTPSPCACNQSEVYNG